MTDHLRFRNGAPAIALATVVALLLAGVAVVLYGERSYKTQKINEAMVQAQILASTVTAALDFKDQDAAQEYVNALKANPEVEAAAVYDATGTLFVKYSRRADRPPPATAHPNAPYFADDRLIDTEPVSQGGTLLGTVYFEILTEPFVRRLERYGVIALLTTMAALVVGVLGFSQRALTRANAELERRALDLAVANASLLTEISEREKAEAALRQAQKMEAIGRLTGGLAHDFNNLLQVVLGNLDPLLSHAAMKADETVRHMLETALAASERGASLTRQLLAFGRKQPLAPRAFDVNSLVANLFTLLHRTLGESIEIETILAADLNLASADAHQLESALLNLAVNARDAMPKGGRISIETANAKIDEALAVSYDEFKAGDYVMITVSDTGVGMAPEVAAKAFDPFFTTKEVGGGSGLGLSQVYGYAKQSGGHALITSEPGRGTKVTLYLPRSADDRLAVEPEDSQAPLPRPSGKETVLVVEDEKLVLLTAVRGLTTLGYHVLAADQTTTALEILKSAQPIDVLFSDVVMPGDLSGVELAAEAARLRPKIKILLVSGYPRMALSHEHGLGEEIPLLQKPYRTQDLAARLRTIMHAA
jgi:signal transduction histidine kinase